MNKTIMENGVPVGWFKETDLKIYWEAVMTCQPGDRVVELGSWLGRSASMVFPAVQKTGAKLTCIDLWAEDYAAVLDLKEWMDSGVVPWEAFQENMKRLGIIDHIGILRMHSYKAAELFEDDSVQVVYIDADHSYAGVMKDIDAWYPKVKKDGWIMGHDFSIKGVRRAATEKLGQPHKRSGSSWGYQKK